MPTYNCSCIIEISCTLGVKKANTYYGNTFNDCLIQARAEVNFIHIDCITQLTYNGIAIKYIQPQYNYTKI